MILLVQVYAAYVGQFQLSGITWYGFLLHATLKLTCPKV